MNHLRKGVMALAVLLIALLIGGMSVSAAEPQKKGDLYVNTKKIRVYDKDFDKILGYIPAYGKMRELKTDDGVMKIKSGKLVGYIKSNKVKPVDEMFDKLLQKGKVTVLTRKDSSISNGENIKVVINENVVSIKSWTTKNSMNVNDEKPTFTFAQQEPEKDLVSVSYVDAEGRLSESVVDKNELLFKYDLNLGHKLKRKVEKVKKIPYISQLNYPQRVLKGSSIYMAGCGYCSVAMVSSYINDEKVSVFDVVDKLENYFVPNAGAAWTMFSDGVEKMGLKCERETSDISVVKKALKEGKPVICSQGPGYFTRGGHIIVLAGMKDGKIKVLDPASYKRTGYWSPSAVDRSAKNYWIYEAKDTRFY